MHDQCVAQSSAVTDGRKISAPALPVATHRELREVLREGGTGGPMAALGIGSELLGERWHEL